MIDLPSKYPWFVFVSTLDGEPRPLNTIARVWGITSSGFYSEQAKEAFSILEGVGFLRKVGDTYVANLRDYDTALKKAGFYEGMGEEAKIIVDEWDKWYPIITHDIIRPLLEPFTLKEVLDLGKYTVREEGWTVPIDIAALILMISPICDEDLPEEVREGYRQIIFDPILSSLVAKQIGMNRTVRFWQIPLEVKRQLCDLFPLIQDTTGYKNIREEIHKLGERMEQLAKKLKKVR